MGINWFEGGRRVFGLFSGILLLSSAAYIVFGGGDNRVILETNSPSDRLKWTLKECSYPDRSKSWTGNTVFGKGETRIVVACFRANENENIWYNIEEEQTQIPKANGSNEPRPQTTTQRMLETEAYSSEADFYMNRRMNNFQFEYGEHEAIAKGQWMIGWVRFWDRVAETAPWAAGGLFVLWALTALIGWIVRGFAGIPSGRDFRSETVEIEIGSRSSADWIVFSGTGTLVLGGVAWAISAGTSTAAPKISQFVSKLSTVLVGLLAVGLAFAGGFALWALVKRLRSQKIGEIDSGVIFGMAIVNLVLVGLASWALSLYGPIGQLFENLDQWSRANGYADGGPVALFSVGLLWPLVPLFLLRARKKAHDDDGD
tara:strand:+ start:13805 stop:14920 length:1116 start_codon:yes stop_codon:yes gene_type:complete